MIDFYGMIIPPEILTLLSTIVTGILAFIVRVGRDQRKREREEHQREMTELRNEMEREKAQNEQHRSLSNILQITIEKNSETQASVASAIKEFSGTQRQVEKSNEMLKDVLEVVSQQLGNVNTSVQRSEAQSLQTLQVVTAQTQVTQDSVDSIKATITQSFELVENALRTLQKRFDDMIEIQSSHVEAQSERHTEQLQKGEDMRRELKAVADAIATMTTVVSNIHRLVQTIEPPALPEPQDTVTPVTPATNDNEDKLSA